MKTLGLYGGLLVAALALSGCGDGDSLSFNNVPGAGPGAGAGIEQLTFTALVENMFANTNDTDDPVEINRLQNLLFTDQDNEAAFDSLLMNP